MVASALFLQSNQLHGAVTVLENEDVPEFLVKLQEWSLELQPWDWLAEAFTVTWPLVAIPLSLLGSLLSVVAMMLMKSALASETDSSKPLDIFWFLNLRILQAFALYFASGLVTWIALGIAPSTVLSCFSSLNVVITLVIAPSWFGEEVTPTAKRAAAVMVLGCCWVACSGPDSYRLDSISEVNLLFAKHPFLVCSVVCFSLVLTGLATYFYWCRETVWSPVTNLAVCMTASIFGSYSCLFAKCTSISMQIVLARTDAEDALHALVALHWTYQFYLWLVFTSLCGAVQMYFMNESLRHGNASFVIPAYQSVGLVAQIVIGGILFQEFSEFTLQEQLLFWPGVLIVVASIGVITGDAASKAAQDDKVRG
eukprot:TRINITY_DN76459_c0_g1_i1.p1 TRINITY_DN76459_c0_g1~~TRINITY_DN76459_c0_g1_i1.p1  ORF type:complete len:368 (+),score=69.57 TRINITY_DN76459_c0_g1_i1:49-1152(+)